MCGIAGSLNLDSRPADPALLRSMIAMVSHRGPDATGIHCDGAAGLAHARLSIIDVAGGVQPMAAEHGSLWITFNGEIFNYVELREDLIAKGHRFATHSDTEVLLHLYKEYAANCVQHLNGQWAFAIWDTRRQELFLSRDRLGVRPLFYTIQNGAFLFGSEIKALFAHPGVSRELDLDSIDDIFTFWCTLAPRTAFKGIRELPPGHSALVRDGKLTVERYWRMEWESPRTTPNGNDGARAEELLQRMAQAARIRLRADVPVGAYLSGGLDSTLVTALIRKVSTTHLRTFSIVFDDAEFDESEYQFAAARYLETEHQAVRCRRGDIARAFPQVIWHTETPVLRTAPTPMFLLSKLVREAGYKVVLTGEGADEMFGGYDIFKEAKIRRFWAQRPDSPLRPLLLQRLYPYLASMKSQPNAYRREFFHINSDGLLFSHLPRWDTTSKTKLFFSNAMKGAVRDRDPYAEVLAGLPGAYGAWDGFAQAQYLETSILFPGYILSSQGDRMGMAHAVESRMPFLDPNVVDFARRLPAHQKMRALCEKYLVKRAANGLIPPAVGQRHKQPYRAPESVSFLDEGRPGYVDELLSPERIARDGIFHAPAVGKLVAKIRQSDSVIGTRENMALVGILSTQLLLDQFVNHFAKRD